MFYNTRQKEIIFNVFKNNEDNQYDIERLKEILKGENIGQATLYRHLDSLVKNFIIKKYTIDGKVFYKYSSDNHCEKHFHLICNKCKTIIHLSCNEVNHLTKHIKKEHGFNIDQGKVVFYGLCDKCVEEDKHD